MDDAGSRLDSSRLHALLRGTFAGRVRRLLRNRVVLFGIGPAILLMVGLVFFALNVGKVATDDATVAAARVAISPEVRGRITEVAVHDNQTVKAGDVLIRLDDADYQTALANAQARLANARLQVAALAAEYQQAVAQTSAARTTQAFTQRELTRQRNLFRAGVVSRHDVDDAERLANLGVRQYSISVQAQAAALANLGGSPGAAVEHHPLVMQAQADLDQAQRNLDNTVIRAPRDGVVARVDQIQIGSYTQPAQALFWLISGTPWIDAAFKEDQLTNLRPGQPVKVHIDAYPHQTFRGHVASLSPGTGSSFSVLPSQNTSGNWVKVVQRLNVRIALDDVPENAALAVGLSATVSVDTAHPATGPALRGREQ